jgi:hypothetical protein
MFHVYFGVTAFVTLFIVVLAIMLMLKFGSKWCGLRHTTLDQYDSEWGEDHTYEHKLSENEN